MSWARSYGHWLNIGFYSRFTLPLPTIKPIPTRSPTSTRSSLTLMNCDSFKGNASATLCVQETRDELVEDTFHEAELKKSEESLMDDFDSDSGEVTASLHSQSSDSSEDEDGPEFDVLADNDVLYSWTVTRDVLVLDSTTPWLTPHISITPASDTVGDHAIAWFNQPNYQDAQKLCLPFPDFSENPPPLYPLPPPTYSSSASSPNAVFSLSRFNAMIDRCSEERLTHFHVVIALRRQTFKTVALMASQVARAYRERYDNALPLSKIELPFSWSDPAEPILLASRFHRATLIIDSPNPFRVPHIIINQPPPEDQWVTASNVLNDPQDYGFGRYLVVHARGTSYVNEPEDAYTEFDSGESVEDYGASRFDEEEYEKWEIRVNAQVNEQEEDYGESYCSTLECYSSSFDNDSPELDAESLSSVESPFPETPDTLDDEDFKAAFERALERRALSTDDLSLEHSSEPSYMDGCPLERPTCDSFTDHDTDRLEPINTSPWVDDEDEDDLPPLDEWYQSVIRRTEGPIAA